MKSLEETGGIITDEIYPIMEELALVNPSSGCGKGGDKGKSHYCAMLRGGLAMCAVVVACCSRYAGGLSKPFTPGMCAYPALLFV